MSTQEIGVKHGDHKPKVVDQNGEEVQAATEDVKVKRDTRTRRIAQDDINLDFGCALEAMRNGQQAFRKGWNCEAAGNHCAVYLVEFGADDIVGKLRMFVLEKPDGSLDQWHPSVPDILAEDWCFEPVQRGGK